MKNLNVFVLLLIGLSSAIRSPAADIMVPGDFEGIQRAIKAAVPGDTIWVAPGTYYENLNFLGKEVRVVSTKGRDVTIIDGSRPDTERFGSVATFISGEGPGAVLEGFTLCNGLGYRLGSGARSGGGIYSYCSSPTILNNAIVRNRIYGGIEANGGSPTIRGNIIAENETKGRGGGIHIFGHEMATICNNIIHHNKAGGAGGIGGGISLTYGDALIANNVIAENTAGKAGGGLKITLTSSQQKVINNTIVGNVAKKEGGGIFTWTKEVPQMNMAAVTNNIIWHNQAEQGQQIVLPLPAIANCDIGIGVYEGMNGNVSVDPLFVNAAKGDYRLRSDSPCIDLGANEYVPTGAKGIAAQPRIVDGNFDGRAIVDLGAYEYSRPFMPGAKRFIRRDINDDGLVDLSDAIALLKFLSGGGTIPCADAGDSNDDGKVDIADPIYILGVLFDGAAHLPALCQPDMTGDALGCDTYTSCP